MLPGTSFILGYANMNEELKVKLENTKFLPEWFSPTGVLKRSISNEIKTLIQLRRLVDIFGWDKYDFSIYNYINSKSKSDLICPIENHGIFSASTSNLLKGSGCPKCKFSKLQDSQRKSTPQVIQEFTSIHGNAYNYNKVVYIRAKEKVTITCPTHGDFMQTPDHHLEGNGCPSCSKIRFGSTNIVYLLECLQEGTHKIGITNNLQNRLKGIGGTLKLIAYCKVPNARAVELELHKKYKDYQIDNLTVKSGNTEFFALLPEQIQEVIDYFKSINTEEIKTDIDFI